MHKNRVRIIILAIMPPPRPPHYSPLLSDAVERSLRFDCATLVSPKRTNPIMTEILCDVLCCFCGYCIVFYNIIPTVLSKNFLAAFFAPSNEWHL
ncbi:MAG: hypothetical protein LBG48_05155 [Rickettsiales bacterium]|nr:hypothetical protein [Rickettsiales bacterium]